MRGSPHFRLMARICSPYPGIIRSHTCKGHPTKLSGQTEMRIAYECSSIMPSPLSRCKSSIVHELSAVTEAHRFCSLRRDIPRSRSCTSCCHHKATPLLITLQQRGMLLLYGVLCTDDKVLKMEDSANPPR